MAGEVHKEFPQAYIATNGYTNRNLPPEGVQLDDRMVIMFAAIWSCTLHGYDDDHCWQKVRQGQMLKHGASCATVWILQLQLQHARFRPYASAGVAPSSAAISH